MATASPEYRLNVQAAGKAYSLDFRQAFRFGYVMARTRKFKEAAQVFAALTHCEDPGRAAAIMLAYCKAGLKDYKACNDLLCDVFPADTTGKVENLQAAFVYLSLAMWADATEELRGLLRARPDLLIVCLLLGDVWAYQRQGAKALACYRAAARDRGAVGATARRLVAAHSESHAPR